MSDLLSKTQLSDSKDCPACSTKPILQKLLTRKAAIGDGLTIRRALPHRERRMIGAWCFLDHFGPLDLQHSNGLNVAPHPHMGLQTFTWTLQGDILHRDSLGSKQVIQPGQVNLMTAGHGISHSEESLPDTTLHGVQLWIALPDEDRNTQSEFFHYPNIPHLHHEGLSMYLLAGDMFGETAPTKLYWPIMGLDIHAIQDTTTVLPLNRQFEYGILPLIGSVEIEGDIIDPESIAYLGTGRAELTLKLSKDSRLLLIGGKPFEEEIFIWWNFVGRSKQEIMTATKEWNNHDTRFGEVKDYPGERLTAPEIP